LPLTLSSFLVKIYSVDLETIGFSAPGVKQKANLIPKESNWLIVLD